MEDIIRNLLSKCRTAEEKTNHLREFLQIVILRELSDKGYFKNLSFVGGTALRFLFGLRRFSEDLDFSLFMKKGYEFNKLCLDLQRSLTNYGFDIEVKKKDQKTVQSMDIKFKNLLYALGLSSIRTHKLYIRLEIDTHPPHGWKTQISVINRTFIFTVTHFDLTSLYALKLHACFYRKYTKGRDFYDMIWYLGKKLEPNYVLLNNAVKQTQGKNPHINADKFKDFLADKLADVDFPKIRKDVERFLEDKTELRLFNRKLILGMLD